MNQENTLKLFASALDDDLTIGNNHLLDDLPEVFSAADLLYFFAQRERLWPTLSADMQREVSLAMTEYYLSALLLISSGDYRFDEKVHNLEHCILYGDLLSGAFSERLIDLGQAALLADWLVLLQRINHELLTYSLEGKSTHEKKRALVSQLVEALAPENERESMCREALNVLVNGTQPAANIMKENEALTHCGTRLSTRDLKALGE